MTDTAQRPALLDDVRVLDLSSGIAGAYCSKLYADAGADVVKLETAAGDDLRRWSASGAELAGADGALFCFLNAGKRSVIGSMHDSAVIGLLDDASLLIESGQLSDEEITALRQAHPRLVIVSISNVGRTGPYRDQPANEFILQTLAGSIASRGTVESGPLQVGGQLGEWVAGSYAAAAGVAALHGATRTGAGDHIDVSQLEGMCITMGGYQRSLHADLGGVRPSELPRTTELPSVEPTADGLVGFCTVTRPQFHAFLTLIGREDLIGRDELSTAIGRQRERATFSPVVAEWTSQQLTNDIIERASAMRIPVSPIGDPETITSFDHFVAREVFVENPGGRFVQPRSPYLVDGAAASVVEPAPALGADEPRWRSAVSTTAVEPVDAEGDDWLADLTIVDLTSFWAGPAATLLLACGGADVIKVESVQRPDGLRMSTTKPRNAPNWWDWAALFQNVNLNKRCVTLDLKSEAGHDALARLIAHADVVIENYSPRVLESFGVSWETVQAINPKATLVRMPAFGLTGPWRDRTGFAQTAEQASGMAWMTGARDERPIVPRGPCDPIAGVHAAFITLAAVRESRRTGRGRLVEIPMIEVALNVAAEMTVEFSAYGNTLRRDGNRGPTAAPQNTYRCAGADDWVSIAVMNDAQWQSLVTTIGSPEWALAPQLADRTGRRQHHDTIDGHLSAWCRDQTAATVEAALTAAGVPAAAVLDPIDLVDLPQLAERHFVETFTHPVLGERRTFGMPFRAASRSGGWVRRAAPMLGEHNREVLTEYAGLDDADLVALTDAGVIGTEPRQ